MNDTPRTTDDDRDAALEALLRASRDTDPPDAGFSAGVLQAIDDERAALAADATRVLARLQARRARERRLERFSLAGAGVGLAIAGGVWVALAGPMPFAPHDAAALGFAMLVAVAALGWVEVRARG